MVNDLPLDQYFKIGELAATARRPLAVENAPAHSTVRFRVKGGGTSAQADAVAHGLARALTLFEPALRPILKKAGFLRRDPRAKERRKFGLKKARKAPQWSKR